jgi:hypothetical protein
MNYEPVWLLIANKWVEIPPKYFVIDFGNPTYCAMGFTDSGADYYLLGDVFLRPYYSVWDDDNSRMALGMRKGVSF